MNHALVVLLCFAAVVTGAFLVACRNYLARVAREKQAHPLVEELAP